MPLPVLIEAVSNGFDKSGAYCQGSAHERRLPKDLSKAMFPSPHLLSDQVWLLKGLIASEAGTLTLKQGHLSFATDTPIFDCPLIQVQAIDFPWYYFGAGCVMKINDTKYRLSFIQPGNTAGGEYTSIADARRKGQRWKTALAPACQK